ncbi:MAG: RluA family pseudouridine synthase, partial [Verrucomicrobia bacterium]|nr:RluA family pseudouridine synthase [Verrucomicrobiota bacterium]
GCPVVGDKLYGEDERYYLDLVEGRLTAEQRRRLILPWHALHARCLTYTTWDEQTRRFECEPEPWFREFAGM